MANVAHSTLTGSNLHENKGVSSATDNTVATASSGATVWQKLTASHLTGTGNPFGGQLYHVRESRASNTDSSTTISGGSWATVVLNTEMTDELTLTLSSNSISLGAATYHAYAHLPCYGRDHAVFKLRLYNVTDAAELLTGPAIQTNGSGSATNVQSGVLVNLQGRFTLSGPKTLRLEVYCPNSVNVAEIGPKVASGSSEVYGELFLWKVA